MMKWFKKMLPAVIRCDERDYLIWKCQPEGVFDPSDEGANSILYGSQLRVRENEAAVFFCRQTNGCIQEIFEGPCDVVLETEHFPVLSKINTLLSTHTAPAPAEVYFVNLSQIQMRFGVPYFQIKSNDGEAVNIAVRGRIDFRIADVQYFISLYGLRTFWQDDLKIKLKDRINLCVKDTVRKYITSNALSDLEDDFSEISNTIGQAIQKEIGTEDGILILNVIVSAIEEE